MRWVAPMESYRPRVVFTAALKAPAVGMLKKEDADLDEYVTQKALDGVYVMVAEEEKKIRRDPVGTSSSIIKKVFGALRY